MTLMTRRARDVLGAYPELAAVLAAAVIGLAVQRPLAWLAAHQGINALLVILVFATAVTIDPRALRRLAAAWRHVLAAVLTGITVLPALSWAVAHLVPAGPLRDGVLVTGLAPCEIASVATTALAGGEAAVAAGVLIGSTLATVVLAAPILTLEAGRASFSPAGVIANLAVVVALPLAAGIALRSWPGPAARALATDRAETAASRTALAAVAALVALVAAEVHLSASYAAVAGALALFLGGFGRPRPGPRRPAPPGPRGRRCSSPPRCATSRSRPPWPPPRSAPRRPPRSACTASRSSSGAPPPPAPSAPAPGTAAGRGHPRCPRPCSTWPRPAMLVGDQPHRRGTGDSHGPGAQLHVGDERHAAARRHDRRRTSTAPPPGSPTASPWSTSPPGCATPTRS